MSGLVFRYGNYEHPPGEVTISSITSSVEFSDRGTPNKRKFQWTIQGEKLGDDIDDLTRKLAALERAYERQGQNAGLYQSGGTATVHRLTNGDALGGVRSHGVSYPQGDGVEYVTSRTFSITLEAEYLITDPGKDSGVLEFNETLSFTGTCGPRTIFLFPISGPPEKQTVQGTTTQKIVQSGSATGRNKYPAIPKPMFPAAEHVEMRQITLSGPKNSGGDSSEFGASWSYSFESATPLNGSPNIG